MKQFLFGRVAPLAILLLGAALSTVACSGDDDESGGDGDGDGDGDTAGDGDGDGDGPNLEELCDVEVCAEDSDIGEVAKAVCMDEISDCLDSGKKTEEECIAFGVETCTL